MLKRLSIRNYALIDNTEVEFPKGMTIITGETGAGKSILLGALSLISGQRADSSVLYDPSQKCFVEAEFNIEGYNLEEFFSTNELDFSLQTGIRREINAEGKSRAFINDTPVNLNVLKELTTKLLDIHSQHETLLLNREDFQISVIDSYAGHQGLLKEYKILFKEEGRLRQRWNALKAEQEKNLKDKDFFEFQLAELVQLKLEDQDQTAMEHELQTLTHASEIAMVIEKTDFLINVSEQSIISQVNEALLSLGAVTSYYEPLSEIHERLKSCNIELKDISKELIHQSDKVTINPQREQEIREKLDLIYSLQKKHRVNTVDELIAIQQELETRISSITGADEELQDIEKQIEAILKKLNAAADEISANREKAIAKFEADMSRLLTEVSLPNAILKVERTDLQALNVFGKDEIQFLFTANKGNEFRPLNKVASGGELSRLMLCIKALTASLMQLPTLIFDEIDTGISGEVAQKVGKVIQGLSQKLQLVTITHLPQIAGKGENHLFVYKETAGQRTISRIKLLDKEARIFEIARMISGESPSQAALQNARELLSA